METNPFVLNHYAGPENFCDREAEIATLIEAIGSGRSITLHSIRRMGKTVLIQHLLHLLSNKKNIISIYLDIFDITSTRDFLNILSSKIISAIEKSNEGFIRKVTNYFGKYRPVFSIDTVTGSPSVSLDLKTEEDIIYSLDIVFSIISEQKKKIVIAIDEFQQINEFETKTIPATIRKYMQSSGLVVFIFSGSQRDLLLNITASPKQALYRSTQMLPLGRIDEQAYFQFVEKHFSLSGRKIPDNIILDGLAWTMHHTYYTQYYFNRLFALNRKSISFEQTESTKWQILKENQIVFHSYKNLMTAAQWKLLVAIGKESVVSEPTAQAFLTKHKLGAHSTVRRSLQALLDAQMIYSEYDEASQKSIYKVYDVFLSRWLERL